MLQYLTPTTLKEMYKELEKARTDILSSVKTRSDFAERVKEYKTLGDMLQELDTQYKATTGEALWAEVAIEMASTG